MEGTPIYSPAFVIAVVSAIVGLIVKAVRLQGKVDKLAEELVETDRTVAKQEALLDAHRQNGEIHFNQRISQEVDKRNEQRFVTIEGQLRDIKSLVQQVVK